MQWKNRIGRVIAATALCTAAGAVQAQVSENFDTTPVGALPVSWTSTTTGAGAVWAVTNAQSNSAPNSVTTNDVATVSSQFLELPPIVAAGTVRLDFWKSFQTEATYDGFVVEVQINGGGYTNIGTAAFTLNGYNQAAISANFASPIAGQAAFSGAGLTWTNSVALISATAGDSVQFRFHMASDSSVASTGVWLDNIITSTSSNFGACCDTFAGTCTLNTAALCTGPGFSFQGSGSACPSVCPTSGACCNNATAVCSIRGAAGCGAGNTYQGDGSVCTPLPCATEACCNTVTSACTIVGPGSCPSGTVGQGSGSVCTPTPCPAPSNDNCADVVTANAPRIPGAGGTVMGSNATATDDGVSLCTAGHKDVYFLFTPATNNAWIFRTCATLPTFDTMISIHTGCPADTSTQVAGGCNDDSCGLLSSVTVAGLSAGTQYIVRVGNFSAAGAGGTFTLEVVSAQLGACCSTTTGACSSSTTGAPGCAAGSTYQGDNTTCTPSPCMQEACCNAITGVCTLAATGTCPSGTTGQGNATTCTPNPCPQPPAPANDECTAAVALTVNVAVTGTLAQATGTDISTCSGSNIDVWYTFTAPAAGSYGATASLISGGFVPAIAIYAPTPCPVDLDTNDAAPDGCQAQGGTGFVKRVGMAQGETILIRVADFGDATAFSVVVAPVQAGACCNASTGICTNSNTGAAGCASGSTYQGDDTVCNPNPCPQPPPPSNDNCSAAIALCDGVAVSGITIGATIDGTATCAGAAAVDVWYSYAPVVSGSVTISLCGSSYDTALAVLDGCGGTQVGCNDDSCGLQSVVTANLNAGTTYLIRVAGFGTATGAFTITATGGGGTCGGPTGVCCRGATCSTTLTSSAACTGSLVVGQTAGASFPTGATCNSTGVTNTPCCYADYNKAGGVTVNDIFDFLNDWFAGSPYANTGGNGSGGVLAVQNIFDFLNAWFAGGC